MADVTSSRSSTFGLDLDLSEADSRSVDLTLSPPDVPAASPVSPVRRGQSLVVITDAVSLAVAFAIGALARQPFGRREGPPFGVSLAHELPFVLLYIVALAAYGLYRRDGRRLRPSSFMDIGPRGHALALGAILTLAASAAAHRVAGLPKIGWVEVVFMTAPAVVLVPMGRGLVSFTLRGHDAQKSRVIIVGSGVVATSLAGRMRRFPDIRLLGFVDDDPHLPDAELLSTYLGPISSLPSVCRTMQVDRVLVAFSRSTPTSVTEVLRQLPPSVRISVVPRLFELVTWQSQMEELHGLTVMDVAPPRLGLLNRTAKRSLDIVASAALLLVSLPAMAVIAVAIKLTSPGPVLFVQDRVGYKGATFKMIKFRTMQVGADVVKLDLRAHNDVDGPLFKLHNDHRVTAVGRFLRKTSLDELPQLLNVLVGNMSLVGPRPFVPDESAGIDGWATRRFEVRPGMTGLWQTSGRNDLPFEELRQLDYAYVASWSLWWDLKILWHTPGSVLHKHGAY
ncbi:MAG TPA: sugar transferase [Acidimicrobiales bacterium]|nr:sugar transferase [Acidimicrobiales bacterium]